MPGCRPYRLAPGGRGGRDRESAEGLAGRRLSGGGAMRVRAAAGDERGADSDDEAATSQSDDHGTVPGRVAGNGGSGYGSPAGRNRESGTGRPPALRAVGASDPMLPVRAA